MKKIAQFVCSVSSLGLMAVASPALAQQAPDGQAQPTALPATDAQAATPAPAPQAPATQGGQGEIVVTGSRLREESVQETPIAVSVVNNRIINDLHATDITALATIAPSLNISYNPTGNSVPFISLRGFVVVTTEISTEPGVSVYIDGIYQPTISGSLSELYDVERVEVLRGPQSALLGKSSSAGALLIRRIRPSDHFDANIEATYGADNLFQTQGRVTFPIIPGVLSAHVYGLYRHRDDYVDNQFPGGHDLGGEDTYEMRGALRFTPTPYVDWYLSGQYDHRRPSQAPVRSIAPITDAQCTFYHDCTNDAGLIRVDNTDDSLPSRQREFDLVSELNIDMAGMKLTSLTGYREFHYLNNSDVDGTAFPLLNVFNQTTDSLSDSQEVRFSSIHNGGWDMGGRLAWLIGGFYNHGNILLEEPHVQYNGTVTPTSNDAGQRSIRDGYALFGHLDFDITNKLTVSFGGRQSWDHVRHLYSFRAVGTTVPDPLPNSQEASFHNFSIEAGAQYKFNDHVMGYLRYAEGYRSGGFIGFPGSAAVAAVGYGPETSRSYEAGLRSELFNRKLLFNLTVYNTEFQNLQRSETVPSPTAGFVVVTGNVASARTRGVELETVWRPVQGLNIRGTIGYIDPVYTDYTNNGVDLSNTRFSFAPRWTVSLDPSYEFRIGSGLFDTMRLQGQWAYKSTYLAAAQDIPEFTQHGYSQVDASITLTGGHNTRYSISAFVQNAFNQNYLVYGTVAAPLFEIVFDNPGRRWGITAAVHF